jgi:hypothetical protein
VYDGRYQTQVHQRLGQEKYVSNLPVEQEHGARAIAGEDQGEHDGDTDDERFLGAFSPDESSPEQHAHSQDQAAGEDPGE